MAPGQRPCSVSRSAMFPPFWLPRAIRRPCMARHDVRVESSAPTSPTACTATNAASVVTAIGMMCSADSARICASGHGHPLASPRRRAAHYHDEGIQQQERYSTEEQARDNVRDRRAVATGEIPPGAPGPERVADTERLAEWHLAAPGDVRAASGKAAFGHRVAAAPGHAAAGLTIRHRPVRFSNRFTPIPANTTRPIALPIATQAHPRRR